jgi:hypothetical protein
VPCPWSAPDEHPRQFRCPRSRDRVGPRSRGRVSHPPIEGGALSICDGCVMRRIARVPAAGYRGLRVRLAARSLPRVAMASRPLSTRPPFSSPLACRTPHDTCRPESIPGLTGHAIGASERVTRCHDIHANTLLPRREPDDRDTLIHGERRSSFDDQYRDRLVQETGTGTAAPADAPIGVAHPARGESSWFLVCCLGRSAHTDIPEIRSARLSPCTSRW